MRFSYSHMPWILLQVQFAASNSLAAPARYRQIITQNSSQAFTADPQFYAQYGPMSFTASDSSAGFIALPTAPVCSLDMPALLMRAAGLSALIMGSNIRISISVKVLSSISSKTILRQSETSSTLIAGASSFRTKASPMVFVCIHLHAYALSTFSLLAIIASNLSYEKQPWEIDGQSQDQGEKRY